MDGMQVQNNRMPPQLKSLHLLPFLHRISLKVCLQTFHCLHSLTPKYLSSYIKPVSVVPSRASLPSSTSGQILIPRLRTVRFGTGSFGYSAPAAWNSLLKDWHDNSISFYVSSVSWRHTCFVTSLTVAERRALLSLHLYFVAQYEFFVIIIIITTCAV